MDAQGTDVDEDLPWSQTSEGRRRKRIGHPSAVVVAEQEEGCQDNRLDVVGQPKRGRVVSSQDRCVSGI